MQLKYFYSSSKPAIHRFFDTSPVSNCGNYLIITEFENDTKLPSEGVPAYVVVVNISDGSEVYRRKTFGWDSQLGAQTQWSFNSKYILFNDVIKGKAIGLKVDILSKTETQLDHTIYMASPVCNKAISPNLSLINFVQAGYGVHIPNPEKPRRGFAANNVITEICLETGNKKTLITAEFLFKSILTASNFDKIKRGFNFIFHVKYSPNGKNILIILRNKPKLEKLKSSNFLVNYNIESGEVNLLVTPKRWGSGHHPNWCPDSLHIVMNLNFRRYPICISKVAELFDKVSNKLFRRYIFRANPLRIALINSQTGKIANFSGIILGSGHPIMHSDMTHVITDCYPHEPVANADASVPLRLITKNQQKSIINLETIPTYYGPNKEWRIDPHPVFSKDFRYLVFNFKSTKSNRTVGIIDFEQYIRSIK
ncbi:hypothetical protein [Paraglaciecola sp. 25GB23A]|uniref:hypothetical protein n=1 Tax=Paraglaciecola sp. 25GB23A TaxID=3156068 RepID=UPI0032AF35A1